jgi:predicted ATPase
MLTRIEIDGFKSFEHFSLDLSPFVVILGPNASGKSNLFDAIQFLSNLASKDLREAVSGLRGEVDELFRYERPGESVNKMRMAVETLVEPVIRDPWSGRVELNHTRIRYEITIERRKDERGIERLMVAREEARPILAKNDAWKIGHSVNDEFRNHHIKYARRSPWLETAAEDDQPVFRIRQDGKAGRTRPAHIPEATVLSSITTTEFPHLFALREEMRSWRFLQLNPATLRQPTPMGPIFSAEMLLPDGSNLAAVLSRIKAETRDNEDPKGALADISAELAHLIPGVVEIDVIEDVASRQYQVSVKMRDEFPFPARVVSDGTLRVLALLALLYDPKYRGLVCFEEPENGIHPARLHTLIQRLRERVTDPALEPDVQEEPLTQLLINSHSPVVLSALKSLGIHEREVFFADLVTSIDRQRRAARRKTRIRPVQDFGNQYHLEGVDAGEVVAHVEVEKYLNTVDREG